MPIELKLNNGGSTYRLTNHRLEERVPQYYTEGKLQLYRFATRNEVKRLIEKKRDPCVETRYPTWSGYGTMHFTGSATAKSIRIGCTRFTGKDAETIRKWAMKKAA